MKSQRLSEAIPAPLAQRVYDRIGPRYDWFSSFESRAKSRALELLNLAPGQHLLNVGAGTGKEHVRIHAATNPPGTPSGSIAVGIDISPVMLALARRRSSAPLCRANALALPFAASSFDRLYAAYVLDLLPATDLPQVLAGFRRVLVPGGRMVVLCLAPGVDFASRLLVGAWEAVYTINPVLCAGCRPLQLAPLLPAAGFTLIHQETVVQLGVPSQIIVAE